MNLQTNELSITLEKLGSVMSKVGYGYYAAVYWQRCQKLRSCFHFDALLTPMLRTVLISNVARCCLSFAQHAAMQLYICAVSYSVNI